MDYVEDGNLRQYLNDNFDSMNWENKLYVLKKIVKVLRKIHNNGLIHRDFHCGNILHMNKNTFCITDLGLCQPADQNSTKDNKKQVYGVLPYVAPEVLREKEYTQASDIYGFGIIAHELITGLPPFYDIAHEEPLAIRICQGLRPISDYQIPQPIVNIIKECWDADPLKRPKANELYNSLYNLRCETTNTKSIIYKQIKEADRINSLLSSSATSSPVTSPTDSKYSKESDKFYISLSPSNLLHDNLSYTKHPRAVYTSRLLDFENLPKPRNNDDSFEDDLFEIENYSRFL